MLFPHTGAAFILLTSVAISKTLLTKLVLEHIDAPVAFSLVSCASTWIMLTPLLVCLGLFGRLDHRNVDGVIAASVMIALDLAFANVALSHLTVALQQCIRATAPVVTMCADAALRSKQFSRVRVATVASICIGPILMVFDTFDASSDVNGQALGVTAMLLSVLAGALKSVAAHQVIAVAKGSMSVWAFTWWVEMIVAVLLLPWAIWTGGAADVLHAPPWLQGLTVVVAAYGGVRVLSQFYFLRHTSPTSLAMSVIVIQVLTTLGGVVFFGDPTTPWSSFGMTLTISSAALYAWLVCLERS